MKWLLESELFQEDEAPLIAALDKLGVPYTEIRFGKDYKYYIEREKEPAVFHGSLQCGKAIKSFVTPIKVYCDLPKFECTYYYPHFGNYLLNKDYAMVPFGDLERRRDWLYATLSNNGELFFRPSSGYKTFTGTVVHKDNWEDWKEDFRYYDWKLKTEDIIIAAPVQKVLREWRFIVVNDEVVTGGQYKENYDNVRIEQVPDKVSHFAQEVVDFVRYRPDPAWTIDIGETKDGLCVVEVGSFSCAGLYACDYEKVVKAINSLR